MGLPAVGLHDCDWPPYCAAQGSSLPVPTMGSAACCLGTATTSAMMVSMVTARVCTSHHRGRVQKRLRTVWRLLPISPSRHRRLSVHASQHRGRVRKWLRAVWCLLPLHSSWHRRLPVRASHYPRRVPKRLCVVWQRPTPPPHRRLPVHASHLHELVLSWLRVVWRRPAPTPSSRHGRLPVRVSYHRGRVR
jgi:hypothetical protein